MRGLVVAHVVTYNSEEVILPCLTSLLQQNIARLGYCYEVWVTDNNSQDKTSELIGANFGTQVKYQFNKHNLGFSRAHNQALSRAMELNAEYVLVINPDLVLETDALEAMIYAIGDNPRAGFCCPKLLRADSKMQPIRPAIIDAAGMYFTKNIRHFDRGSGQLDYGQFDNMEYVSGGSGAALLFKRDFILDASLSHDGYCELFDDTFFAYREDADLAWRSLWLGWRCVYQPRAIGYHRRFVLPTNRAQLPSELNRFSVRNRFLLQIKNFSLSANYHCIIPAMLRNLLVICAVIIKEHSSLLGLGQALRYFPRMWRKRRAYRLKHRESPLTVSRHFCSTPFAEPILTASNNNPNLKSLTIVVISYQSGELIRTCLNKLNEALPALEKHCSVQIAIVDNDQSNRLIDELVTQYGQDSRFIFLRPRTNLGFAGGIGHARDHVNAAAYLIINPDILVDAPAILELMHCAENYDNLAVVSPLLLDQQGKLQRTYTLRRLPTIKMLLAELFLLNRFLPHHRLARLRFYEDDKLVNDYLLNTFPHVNEPYEHRERPLVIEQPAGACLLIKDSVFNSIGCFNTDFWPAWFEDVDFCQRAKDAGLLAAVTRKAQAIHEGGYSRRVIWDAQFYRYYYSNMFRYVKKHERRMTYYIFRVFAAFGLTLKALVVFFAIDCRQLIVSRSAQRSFSAPALLAMIFTLVADKPSGTY